MKHTWILLAGAAALALTAASAEPPHGQNGQNCPPREPHCVTNHGGTMNGPGPMNGPGAMNGPGPKAAPGPVWKGGPGGNKGNADWAWQDDRGGWHRDHDRYWRPDFRGGFAPQDRLFFVLRQHHYNRFDGDPYWFRGHFVIKTFDRFGRPTLVELNPYTGEFIGVIRF
jgi:hypothetical protein